MARKGDFMSESFTLYKLIVLYMLDKVDFPLTNGQISEFILDKGYTSYFTLQQAISEMVESGFLREETTHNRTLYHLTPDGAETIKFFKNKNSFRCAIIPSPIIETLVDLQRFYDSFKKSIFRKCM